MDHDGRLRGKEEGVKNLSTVNTCEERSSAE